MPEGWDPHVELQRIYNLQELMTGCRQRTPITLALVDNMLASEELAPETRIRLIEMLWNRGYGKPRQTVYINDDTSNQSQSRVKVYLPENGRPNQPGKVIDADAA
jgi:hypothetical protein